MPDCEVCKGQCMACKKEIGSESFKWQKCEHCGYRGEHIDGSPLTFISRKAE